MIKFFRKIRYDLMEKNKTGKYLKYAIGEIVLVVIGILIALSINNWNETRKIRIQERELLVNLKNALTSDVENQFKFHLQRTKSSVESLGLILDYITSKRSNNNVINEHFGTLSIAARITWTPQLTAYKRLESKGIEIIENDELLEAILNIYTLDYPRISLTFDNYKRNIYEYGRPIVRREFIDDYPNFIPVNYEGLLSNVEFRNTVKVLLGNGEVMYARLTEIEGNVQDVIKLIDVELN